jgi:ParB family transcriptional regulator, chromosome partitioning protein
MSFSFKASDEARRNRLASMTDARPADEAAPPAPPRPGQFQGRTALREACLIRLDRIVADPNQPRAEFDADSLERLAKSLKDRGQLQPIRVRWNEADGVYVVVIGERRWRAARLAGMESIACVVVPDTATPEELLEDQLIENCVREDLKPVEQARAYRTLMDRLGLSQRALAEKLSVSQGQVMQALKLLELPSAVQGSIDAGEVPPSVGYEIAKIADPVRQVEMAGKVARGEAGREDIRDQTVKAPRAKRWSCTLDDGAQVTVAIPGREVDVAAAVEKLQAALKRARAELARSRSDAA